MHPHRDPWPRAWRKAIGRYLRRTPYRRLPCGCAVTLCPCCGKAELVIDASFWGGECEFGDSSNPQHRQWLPDTTLSKRN